MDEDTSDAMNLDLNLGPGPETGSDLVQRVEVSLDDMVDDPLRRIREAVRVREAYLFRSQQRQRLRMRLQNSNISAALNHVLTDSDNAGVLQTGEGSVVAEDRPIDEVPKICEHNSGILESVLSDKTDGLEKEGGDEGSFFDCNVCMDLATDPVVTCCGHLFCWSCLYRWLHVHSDTKECPVCKGEVTEKNITPIYGRGNNTREPDPDPSVPGRPQARRVESLRQTIQRNPFSFPVEEMIRHLQHRFDLVRELPQPNTVAVESTDRPNVVLNRVMSSRGIRGEQNSADSEAAPSTARRLHSILLRRSQSHTQRSPASASLLSALNSAERLVETYSQRNSEQPQGVDDRDSFSSIAAVNSESQMDTAAEIDSMVSLSTSSRRRHDASVDSGDSRAPRRRRLN